MKIYTKTGDTGETGLFGGARVAKDHMRIQAYGSVDELNSVIGILITSVSDTKILLKIQNDLFNIGTILATPDPQKIKMTFVNAADVISLEHEIDLMEKNLPELKNFILPGGDISAAYAHLARTVCRRAERDLVTLSRQETVDSLLIQYMNRLSDYFFVLARFLNHQKGIVDIEWNKKG